VTSIPLSRLYVLGGGTLWAPALLHSAIDSFKLVAIPPAAQPIYPFLLIGFSLVVPLLVLAARPGDARVLTPDQAACPLAAGHQNPAD
jgi:hypothetical protein